MGNSGGVILDLSIQTSIIPPIFHIKLIRNLRKSSGVVRKILHKYWIILLRRVNDHTYINIEAQ